MSIAATAKPGTVEEDSVAVLVLLQHIATVGANPVWLADAADAAVRVANRIWVQVNAYTARIDPSASSADANSVPKPLFDTDEGAGTIPSESLAPSSASKFKRPISRSQVQEALAAALLFAVRQLSGVDSPHVNAMLWLRSLQGQVAIRLASSLKAPSAAPSSEGASSGAYACSHSHAKSVTIALALTTVAVVTPVANRMAWMKDTYDLRTFFLDMDYAGKPSRGAGRTRLGGVVQAEAQAKSLRMPKPGMSSAWLSMEFNAGSQLPAVGSGGRDGLTPSSAPAVCAFMPFHVRSFLGVQARRIRLRWKLLNDQGVEVAHALWQKWLRTDRSLDELIWHPDVIPQTLLLHLFRVPSRNSPYTSNQQEPMDAMDDSIEATTSVPRKDGPVAYPHRRLARPGAWALAPFHPRSEGEQETRVTAYDRFVRALWAGDRSQAPVLLRSFFDYVPRSTEHQLHHHALLSLAALELSSSPSLVSSGPYESEPQTPIPYTAIDASVAALAAARVAHEAASLARLSEDRDAMPLSAVLLSRSAALSAPLSSAPWQGATLESQDEAQRAFPSPFPSAGVDLALLKPFSGETLWHVCLSYRYTRSLSPTQALNALTSLNWPRSVHGGRQWTAPTSAQGQSALVPHPISVSASAPADRALLWGARVHAIYASDHRPRPSRSGGNGNAGTGAGEAGSIVPVSGPTSSQTVPLEPPASVGRTCVRADAFRAQIWDEMGTPAVADVLLAHVLRRPSVPLVVGSAPLAPSVHLSPASQPAALGAPPGPATTAPIWAAAETSVPLDALLQYAARTALSGQYARAMAQLFHPTVVNALSQPSLARWVAAVGGVLALQARRADRLRDLKFLQAQGLLDAVPDVLAQDPREFAGLPPSPPITPAQLAAGLASGAPWAHTHASTLGLADLAPLSFSASLAASHSNARQACAIVRVTAGVLAHAQLVPDATHLLDQWPSAFPLAYVDPNPEVRAWARIDSATVQLGLLTSPVLNCQGPLRTSEQRSALAPQIAVHWTRALEDLEYARKDFSRVGSVGSLLYVLGLQVSLVTRRPVESAGPNWDLGQLLDQYAALESQLQFNRTDLPSHLVQRVAGIVDKVGVRYTRVRENEIPHSQKGFNPVNVLSS